MYGLGSSKIMQILWIHNWSLQVQGTCATFSTTASLAQSKNFTHQIRLQYNLFNQISSTNYFSSLFGFSAGRNSTLSLPKYVFSYRNTFNSWILIPPPIVTKMAKRFAADTRYGAVQVILTYLNPLTTRWSKSATLL